MLILPSCDRIGCDERKTAELAAVTEDCRSVLEDMAYLVD